MMGKEARYIPYQHGTWDLHSGIPKRLPCRAKTVVPRWSQVVKLPTRLCPLRTLKETSSNKAMKKTTMKKKRRRRKRKKRPQMVEIAPP